EDPVPGRVGEIDGIQLLTRTEFFDELAAVDASEAEGLAGYVGDPDEIAVLLYTSGTTGEPKAAVLRHKHVVSYVMSTVDFMSADEEDAALVSVPPYHVAGTSAVLTGVHAGRRLVYLPAFTPEDWVATARDEAVTQ